MPKLKYPLFVVDGKIGCLPLEEVHGSSYCKFSVVENKLAVLSENQKKIYALLQIILENQAKGLTYPNMPVE